MLHRTINLSDPLRRAAGLVAALAAGLCGSALAQPAGHAAAFKSASGQAMGSANLTFGPKGVLVHVELTGLTPGWHAMHFHEKGDCSDAKFQSAGAHVHSAGAAPHGYLNPGATDLGDLPNVFANAKGEATAEVYSTLVSADGADERGALLDADGSAVVIHASPDDYRSQPIGGAGARVACAVIR